MKKYYVTILACMVLIFKAQCQNWSWADQYASLGSAVANNIIKDNSGNIYITGVFQGSLTIGNDTLTAGTGNWSYYLAKLTGNGTPLWAQTTYSNNGWQEGQSIAIDPLGNIIVTGFYSASTNFGTSACNGSIFSLSGGPSTGVMFLVKYDPAGNLCWAIDNAVVTGLCKGIDIACDSTGIYITGDIVGTIGFSAPGPLLTLTSYGGSDIFIAKFNTSNGFVMWAKNAGSSYTNSSHEEIANSIALDPDGNAYITGSCYSPATFGSITITGPANSRQMFIAKYDSLGAEQWVKNGTGTGYPVTGDDIAADANGMLYVSGTFKDTVYFNAQPLIINSRGAFVVKYDGSGNIIWKTPLQGVWQSDEITVNAVGETFVTGIYDVSLVVQGDTLLNFGTNQNIFVSKFDTAAVSLWNQRAGGGIYNFPHGVANYNNHVYIAGAFNDSTYFGNDTLINNDIAHTRLFIAEIYDSTSLTSAPEIIYRDDNTEVYPNPSNSEISILIKKHTYKELTVSLINTTGQNVFIQHGNNNGSFKKTIDIRSLSQGIYFLEIYIDGERTVKKIVKE